MINSRRQPTLVRPGQATPGRLVGSGDAYKALEYVLSGGMVGRSSSISSTELPLTQITWRDIADYNYPGSSVVISDADPRNTDNSLQILGEPTSISTLPTIFTTEGPKWTINNIGPFPLNSPIPRSYDVAGNFSTIAVQTSNVSVTPTRVGAGANDIQGLITTAVVTTKPDRNNLTRAGLAGLVSGHEHYRTSVVTEAHTAVLAGNNNVNFISGNSVESPGTVFVSSKRLELESYDASFQLLDWAGDGGSIPEYYAGPVDLKFEARFTVPGDTALDESVRPGFGLNMYWANVNSTTGALEITTASKYFYGPAYATPINADERIWWQGEYRFSNPTNIGGTEGYNSYLIGYTVTCFNFNINDGTSITFNTATIEAWMSFPSQSPSGNGPAAITAIEGNYQGPVDVTRTTTGYALPDAERARDYRNSMARPAPSFVGDAVRTALYSVFHAAQGIAFVGQRELDEYLALVSNPSRLLKLVSLSSSNEFPILDNINAADGNPAMTTADEVALEDAGMGPLRLGSKLALAEEDGGPKLKAGLFDFVTKGLGSLGGIAKTVQGIACSPAVSGIVSGLSGLGSSEYGRYGSSARFNSGGYTPEIDNGSEEIFKAAARYRSSAREKGPPPTFVSPRSPCPLPRADTPRRGRGEGSDDYISVSERQPEVDRPPGQSSDQVPPKYPRDDPYDALRQVDTVGGEPVIFKFADDLARSQRLRAGQIQRRGDRRYRASTFTQKSPIFKPVAVKVAHVPTTVHTNSQPKRKFAAATYKSEARLCTPSQGFQIAAANAGIPVLNGLRAADFSNMDSLFFDKAEPPTGAAYASDDGEADSDDEPYYSGNEDGEDAKTDLADAEAEMRLTPAKIPDEEYPTADEFETSMKQVYQSYYPNVASTGAGPIYSSGASKRLKNLQKDLIRPRFPSVQNFPLVKSDPNGGGNMIYIASLCCTLMPMARGAYTADPNDVDSTLATLEKSYRGGIGIDKGKLRVRLDKAFDNTGVEQAINAIKSAVVRYPETISGELYISVDIGDTHINQGEITGDSYTLALFAACLGLPCGPTLTGSIDKLSRLSRIGDINPKLTVFMNQLKDTKNAPLLFPRNSAGVESYKSGTELGSADILSNVGMFEKASETGVIPLTGINSLIAFFLGGGYDAWETRHVDKDLKQIMDRYDAGNKAARQVFHLVVKANKLRDKEKGEISPKTRADIRKELFELGTKFKHFSNEAFQLYPTGAKAENENAKTQQELASAVANSRKQVKKVTTQADDGQWYFQMLNDSLTKRYGQSGSSRSSRQEWAINNLKGKTERFTIIQKDGKQSVTVVFTPKIVQGKRAKKKKDNKDAARKAIMSSNLDKLFDIKAKKTKPSKTAMPISEDTDE